jgi:uncharacterized protein YgbK (DUF1537 family)
MRQLIGIIADDLTGANDSGVQLIERGITTSVYFDIPKQQSNLENGIVIDTNSRALSREEAFTVTKQAGEFLKQAGYVTIYKKMDSTLRGHIGTELEALYETFNPEFVFIAPAFPSLKRTTKDGIHYVDGNKITNTEVSKDPKHPVTEDFIPSLIEKEIGRKVGLLTKSDITGNSSSFQEQIADFREKEIKFIVCDAESQEDLQKAVQKMASISKNVIWSGSAGLAEVLPDVLRINQIIEKRISSYISQVMTVCGSLSSVTQKQVKFAIEQPGVKAMELDTTQIFSNHWGAHCQAFIKECLIGLDEGNDIVLYVPSNDQIRDQVKQIGQALGLTDNQIGERISGAIGKIVASITEINKFLTGLVLIGGDTAKDTSSQLGGVGISLIKQVEAGIPLGTLIGTDREFTIVTKAGSFGKENSIYCAMQALKGDHTNE